MTRRASLRPPIQAMSRYSKLRALYSKVRGLLKSGRRNPYLRKEQLAVVSASHLFLGLFVVVIMLAWFDHLPPWGFMGVEITIVVGCFLLAFVRFEPEAAKGVVQRYLKEKLSSGGAGGPGPWRDRLEGGMLLSAFALQFAALVPLLRETGGPIHSPFAELVVAFAIFTPLLANQWWTMGVVLLLTIVYYVSLVWLYGSDEQGAQVGVWAYAAVNVMILTLTVAWTVLDLWASNRDEPSGSEGVVPEPSLVPSPPDGDVASESAPA
jgi:hypothetical protein